jgi:GAF domain-containing protein
MSETTILIITLRNQPANDDEYNKVVEYCKNLKGTHVVEKTIQNEPSDCKPSELIPSPSDINAVILWCHDKSHDKLPELRSIIDIAKRIETDKSLHSGCIIVLDHSMTDILDEDEQNQSIQKIRDELLGKSYLLARPVNLLLLGIQIESIVAKIKNKQLLNNFKTQLLEQQNLNEIIQVTLDTLREHPKIGYHRATISLVTPDDEMKRYLLKHHDTNPENGEKTIRRGDLQKPIGQDKLITHVDQKTTFIISNLEDKRKTETGRELLKQWGWTELYSTNEVNSWIGLAAKHDGKTIAIFTLDYDEPNKYDFKDERLYEYLESFGQAFADRIYSFFVKRNKRIMKYIMASIGDKLSYEALIHNIIKSLSVAFNCEECAYFEISNQLQDDFVNFRVTESYRYPTKLYSVAKDSEPQRCTSKTRFRPGTGIIGKVWSEKEPYIVANASEEPNTFIESPHLKRNALSMLVVPVLATNKPGEAWVIGIICCHQQEYPDFFTIYDQLLVQNVAVATANAIERTRILESISDIALKTADMSLDENKLSSLLQLICHSAYSLTSVNSASIHLLEGPFNNEYRQSLKPNFSYPVNHENSPRLKEGVTKIVIETKKTTEFSLNNKNYDHIFEGYKELGIKCKLVIPLMLQDSSHDHDSQLPSKILGCLYLDKYQEDSFSNVEIFTLELLAKHAAISLNKNLMVAEKTINTKSLEGLKCAIDSIAGLEELDKLLQVVAEQAYELCGLPGIIAKPPSTYSGTESLTNTLVWPDLIAYVAKYNEDENLLEVKAAFPEKYLKKLNNAFKQGKSDNKVGISGLSIGLDSDDSKTPKLPKTINVNDIRYEKSANQDIDNQYIEINSKSSSQLSVPILRRSVDGEVSKRLGVITLEHTKAYAFSTDYVRIIEQFAQHVAIAFEQQNSKEEIERKGKIVASLHNSLEVIAKEPSQSMLYKAVTQTREALKAKAVYVVPVLHKKASWVFNQSKLEIQLDKCVPSMEDFIKKSKYRIISNENHANGFNDSHSEEAFGFSFEDVAKKVFHDQKFQTVRSQSDSGYCFPFSSARERIGVVWILLSRPSDIRSLDEEVISSYVNQIALSYTNSTQFHDLITRSQNDLDQQMKEDNANVRSQSNKYFVLAFVASCAGISLLVLGILISYFDNDNPQVRRLGFFAASTGLVLEACTILVFRQLESANKRLDQYHSERLSVGQLNILLSASDQLTQAESLKSSLIEGAKAKWLSGSEVGKAEPGESTKAKWYAGPERGKVE